MSLVLLILVSALPALLYAWVKYRRGYWRRRGIPYIEPHPFLGNMGEMNNPLHISEALRETYDKFKPAGKPFAGFFFVHRASVVVTDVNLVKNILVKDFSKFRDRGIYNNVRDDPLTGNLFFLDGEMWHHLRHKMSPTFTSGKMKLMFPTVVNVGQELAAVFAEKLVSGSSTIQVVDLLSRYTADVIGTCAFGLECNSLRDPQAEFVQMGRRFVLTPRHHQLIDLLIHSFPKLARMLRMRIIDQKVHEFYMRIVKETIAYREANNVKRNDFMDIMIELKNAKSMKDEQGNELAKLTVDEVAAQAFVFFLAGFETSSTTMGFALYELARHQEIQDKLRQEINRVMEKLEGEVLTYDSMKAMPYLEQVILETLRLHPVLAHLTRESNEHYETSDSKYYIEKGTLVMIPSISFHYDPEFYPEPEKFRPERFTAEEIQKRQPCTYLPFGEGPRNCIGMRFGIMQTTIGLAYLIRNFRFSVAPETQIPYKLVKKNFILNSENGIYLRVEKIK